MKNTSLALYIHWPFCLSKCPYCDFNSHVRQQIDAGRWQAALLNELETMAKRVPGRELGSIFFGGGTPSLMPPETVEALIAQARTYWPSDSDLEITLEANPTSAEAGRFAAFRAAGVSRLSLGVQSLDDTSLRFLGRGHSAGEARRAIAWAREHFPRYSFDLIYARPQQSLTEWEAELRDALEMAGGHLSLYQLTIEENTAFHHAYHQGGFTLPDEAQAEALYRLTHELTAAHGLHAYEISNYALPGHESRHNLTYWKGGDYAGIGPGAHGRLMMPSLRGAVGDEAIQRQEPGLLPPDDIRCRNDDIEYIRIATQTIKSPERWLEQVESLGHGLELEEPVDRRRESEERLMMGLRLSEGIDLAAFRNDHGYDIAQTLDSAKIALFTRLGLLEDKPGWLRPSLRGRLVLTSLTAELLA